MPKKSIPKCFADLPPVALATVFSVSSLSGRNVTKHHIAVFDRPRQPCKDQQQENNSMRRATLTFVALLGLGVVQLTAVPALAEYGAIAWDEATGKVGSSWNQTTAQRAAEVALSECGSTGCKVVIHPGRRECAALATTESGKIRGRGRAQGSRRSPACCSCQLQEGQGRRVHRPGDRLQQVTCNEQ